MTGPFLGLEPRLFGTLAEHQSVDPLRRVSVIVTSNLLGVHLRRRYLEWRESRGLAAAHAGISFSNLEEFAGHLAGQGPVPLPEFGEFAILSDALARLPESRAFGDLASRPDFVPSLEATIRDLADAGVTPSRFRSFAENPSLAAERRVLLGAVARLYEELENGTGSRETSWRLLRRAAGATRAATPETVFLYGFYDATGAQKDFLAALARRFPIFAFVPRPVGSWGDFAEPFLAWTASTLEASPEAAPEANSPLEPFRLRLGEGPTAAEFDGEGGPARLVSAATSSGERAEIAREILIAAEAGVPLHRMAIIVRESSSWSEALSRELTRLGIPNFDIRGRSLASSTLGRAVRLWWDLEERDFSREDVLGLLDLLADAPGRDSRPSARSLARKAGIVRGETAWKERLEGHASGAAPAEAAASLAFAEECGRLIASASSWPGGARSWREWADELSGRLEVLFLPAEVPDPLRAAAEALSALDESGVAVERPTAGHVFFAALEKQREASGRLGVDGVCIGTVMATRGLTFEASFVARLVEREFPLPGRPDPLLFDSERLVLAERTGRPVPLKVASRSAEERLLFGVAVGSAARRLVLTTARRDEALTRDCLPSHFFADAERAASSRAGPATRNTEMGRAVVFGPAVSVGEACERVLESSGTATVAAAYAPLRRSLLRQELSHSPRWTAFEGRLGPEARKALERHRPSALESLSASKLGKFGACPYRYFLHNVQGLREWEELDRSAELGPLHLGNAFHDAARRIVGYATSWPPSGDEGAELAARAAEEALALHEEKTAPLHPELVRGIARARIEDLIHAWLAHEAGSRDGLRPAAAEKNLDTPEIPFRVDAGPFSVRFVGSIDRVDDDREGRAARVIDYKVKMASGFQKAFDGGGRILGGEAVQLPIYALATGERVASEYLVLRSVGPGSASVEAVSFPPDQTSEAIGHLRTFLRGMEEAVGSGTFAPRTATRLNKWPCSFCEFSEVCGPGHIERFEEKDDDSDPSVRALKALRDLP